MRRDVIRERPWMCVMCGYLMDTIGTVTGRRPPREADYSKCINCGHVYVRHGDRWVSITAEERAAMPDENRQELERIERARRDVVDRDLSKRGGRA